MTLEQLDRSLGTMWCEFIFRKKKKKIIEIKTGYLHMNLPYELFISKITIGYSLYGVGFIFRKISWGIGTNFIVYKQLVFLYLEISSCFDKKILMLLQVIKIGLQLEKNWKLSPL